MPSRATLVALACATNVDHTLAKYQNDSVLEQAVVNAVQSLTASGAATTLVAPAIVKTGLHGGKNV